MESRLFNQPIEESFRQIADVTQRIQRNPDHLSTKLKNKYLLQFGQLHDELKNLYEERNRLRPVLRRWLGILNDAEFGREVQVDTYIDSVRQTLGRFELASNAEKAHMARLGHFGSAPMSGASSVQTAEQQRFRGPSNASGGSVYSSRASHSSRNSGGKHDASYWGMAADSAYSYYSRASADPHNQRNASNPSFVQGSAQPQAYPQGYGPSSRFNEDPSVPPPGAGFTYINPTSYQRGSSVVHGAQYPVVNQSASTFNPYQGYEQPAPNTSSASFNPYQEYSYPTENPYGQPGPTEFYRR